MKWTIIALLLLMSTMGFAQNEKYTKGMEALVSVIDSARTPQSYAAMAAAFERIGDAEKTQWHPYYYAAYTQVMSGYMMMQGNPTGGGMTEKLDPIADKAEASLNKAEAISKNNSEIYVIRKMIASLRMMGDPMSRYMQYGPIAAEALQTARKLDPENPRTYLLEGQDKFYTPEQFGGSKEEAKKLFILALQKFDAKKPASAIEPSWGRSTTTYFLEQAK